MSVGEKLEKTDTGNEAVREWRQSGNSEEPALVRKGVNGYKTDAEPMGEDRGRCCQSKPVV